jgi:hypothetical protein
VPRIGAMTSLRMMLASTVKRPALTPHIAIADVR